MNTPNKSESNDTIVHLIKGKRWFIYMIICSIHSCVLINSGVLSAGITSIKAMLNISDEEFGLFGTFHGLGGLMGSFLFMGVINVIHRKYFLLSVLVLHSLSLMLFCYVTNYYLLIAIRTFHGMCMVICFIYFPLWIDQFGFQKYKSWMMTCLFLTGSLGMLWGYLINLFIGSNEWQKGLWIEAIIVLIFCGLLAIFPESYFSKRITKKSLSKVHVSDALKEKRESRLESIFITHHLSIIPVNDDTEVNAADESSSSMVSKKKDTKDSLFKNPLLLFLSFSKAAQFFNCVAVNYWYSDYLETSLGVINDPNTIFYSFSIVVILGPMLGLVIGGIISSIIGGYESKYALLIVLLLDVLSCPFALVVPLMNDVKWFSVCLFGYKLCDNATGTLSTGLIMTAVSNQLKGKANGFVNIILNIFAFLPAPFVYGYIKNTLSYLSNKSAMYLAMYQGFTATLFMLVAYIIQKNNMRSNPKDSSSNSQTNPCHFDKPEIDSQLLTQIKRNK